MIENDVRRNLAIRLIGQALDFLEVPTIIDVLVFYDELEICGFLDKKVEKNFLLTFMMGHLQKAIKETKPIQFLRRRSLEAKLKEVEALRDLPLSEFYRYFKFQEYDIEKFEEGRTFWDLITQQPNIFIF